MLIRVGGILRLEETSKLKFLTRKEAAVELRCSLHTLDRLISRGELKAKKHGHFTFVMKHDIERYIEEWPDVKPRTDRGTA